MNEHLTEDEQVEAIKKWWKDNGLTVVAGVIFGLVLIFSWRAWQTYQQGNIALASAMYERVVASLQADKSVEAREITSALLSEHTSSTYTALASLSMAADKVKQGEIDAALPHLQWVIDNANQANIVALARLRKARLLLEKGELDKVQAEIDVIPQYFKLSRTVLQGDLALTQEKPEDAKQHYSTALLSESISGEYKQYIQMKLDNLGTASEVVVAAPPTVPEPTPAPDAPTPTDELATPSTATSNAMPIKTKEEIVATKLDEAVATPTTAQADVNTFIDESDDSAEATIVAQAVETAAIFAEAATVNTIQSAEVATKKSDTVSTSSQPSVDALAATPVSATPTTTQTMRTMQSTSMPVTSAPATPSTTAP